MHAKVSFEFAKPLWICAIPLIQDLVIISYYKQILCTITDYIFKKYILRVVSVLKFIHADVCVYQSYMSRNGTIRTQQLMSKCQQGRKIQAIVRTELMSIFFVQFRQ